MRAPQPGGGCRRAARRPGRLLVTGATGIVGTEVVAQARRAGWQVTGVSRRGDRGTGVLSWRMGTQPRPAELAGPWDVVVHAAADTRWNLPHDEATRAVLAPTEALREVVGPETLLVHVSTYFATGLRGAGSPAPEDYRNSYEWSKAAAERFVRGAFAHAVIVRPPMIIGRSTDGAVARFNGIYTILSAATAGLLPAVVGDPSARVELVPVDVTAAVVLALTHERDITEPVHVLGGGAGCLTLGEIVQTAFDTLNDWRAERGTAAVMAPPFVSNDLWERFYLPFSRPHLSERHQATIDLLDAFRPYFATSVVQPVTAKVDGIVPCLRRSVRWWAEQRPRAAARTPRPWSSPTGAQTVVRNG